MIFYLIRLLCNLQLVTASLYTLRTTIDRVQIQTGRQGGLKPAFNVGPTLARQQFWLPADDGPFIVDFEATIPSSSENNKKKSGPPLTKLTGSAHVDALIFVIILI